MITEIRRGRRIIYRTEESDCHDYEALDHVDYTMIKHRWWLPKPDRTDCLVHFVKECISSGSDQMEVLYSSKKGKESTSVEEKRMLWKNYVTKASNKIDTSKLPIEFRSIHWRASKAELVRTRFTRKVCEETTSKANSKLHFEGTEKPMGKSIIP